MRIDKVEIIDVILTHGDDDTAERAQRELPDQVDTDEHDLLGDYGVSTEEVAERLGRDGLSAASGPARARRTPGTGSAAAR